METVVGCDFIKSANLNWGELYKTIIIIMWNIGEDDRLFYVGSHVISPELRSVDIFRDDKHYKSN